MTAKFYAEIGSNHNRDPKRIKHLIEQAKAIGCAGVKFQLFKANMLWSDPETVERMRDWELPSDFVPMIAEICRQNEIEFGCSPFDLVAVEVLRDYVDYFKIASYEILRRDLILACADAGKPLQISVGGSTEIERANISSWLISHLLMQPEFDLTVLHCIPDYPAQPEDCCMRDCLGDIRIEFSSYGPNTRLGYSDHTVDEYAVLAAVAAGAEVIEFHFDDFDLPLRGRESTVSDHVWNVCTANAMICKVRQMEKFMIHRTQMEREERWEEMRAGRTDPETGKRP